jgi:protein ImuB
LWFPRLPTDRLQRLKKGQKSSTAPLVVVSRIDNALRLSAVDRKAASLGLSIGQPLANAQAMLPALDVAHADEVADFELLSMIAQWCDRFTPLVAFDNPFGLLLDITGATHLFDGEQALLDRIRRSLGGQGFVVHGSIAGTAAAARAMARCREVAVIEPGCEAKAVSPLPIDALEFGPVITHAFRRAGLKTIGQAAGRKRSEIVSRFGAATAAMLDEALGRIAKPITPRLPPPEYWSEKNFPEPVATTEVIRDVLQSLAGDLAHQMERHDAGARCFEAVFFRADGLVRRLKIQLGTPVRDPAVVDRLFREKLDALADPLDPGFGFDLIRLCVVHAERSRAEAAELDSRATEAKDIGFLIDRLAVRFGRQSILRFEPRDTHIPELAWSAVEAQAAAHPDQSWKRLRHKETPRRPLRFLRNPEPVEVLTTSQQSRVLCWRKARHPLSLWEGPERIAMEWWRYRSPQPARDYFCAEDTKGRRFWLYQDCSSKHWFLHGIFA